MRKLLTAGVVAIVLALGVGRPGAGLGLGSPRPVAADRGLPVHQPAGLVLEHVLLRVAVPVVRVLQLQPRPLRELDGGRRLRLLQELRPRVPVRPGPRRLPAAAPAAAGRAEERQPKTDEHNHKAAEPARVAITLPADAKLLFNGAVATGTGESRTFATRRCSTAWITATS